MSDGISGPPLITGVLSLCTNILCKLEQFVIRSEEMHVFILTLV